MKKSIEIARSKAEKVVQETKSVAGKPDPLQLKNWVKELADALYLLSCDVGDLERVSK